MPPKLRQLKATLKQAGFKLIRTRGSHTIWSHPLLPDMPITLSGNDGKDAKPYQIGDVQNVLKRLGENR